MQSENRTTMWVVVITAVLILLIGAILILSQNNNSAQSNGTTTSTTSVATSRASSSTSTSAVAAEMEFDLTEQNGSGQDGTVTLEEVGTQVKVTISLSNVVPQEQPAHIHVGKCPTPGAVKFPLQNVVNGSSVTLINATLAELAAMGDLAVNVHKSTSESSVYYSCGNLDFLL